VGGNYFGNAAQFLISVAFGLYILAVMLRVLLQWVRADFYNPISQLVVRVTSPVLVPLRRIVPGWAGIDLAAIVLLLALQCAELLLIGLLPRYTVPGFPGILLIAVGQLLQTLLTMYMIIIIAQAVLSWVNPQAQRTPFVQLLYQLTTPLLRPARRLLPATGALDFAPLLVLIALMLAQLLVVPPLIDLGNALAYPR
jgi:YggT family protein